MSLFQSLFPAHREAEAPVLPSEGRLPPFGGATGWLNSEPLRRRRAVMIRVVIVVVLILLIAAATFDCVGFGPGIYGFC